MNRLLDTCIQLGIIMIIPVSFAYAQVAPSGSITDTVCTGNGDRLTYLIEKGAEINSRDKDGNTALMRATECGDNKSVEILIAKGADVNSRNNSGQTALMLAALDSNVVIASMLLKKGVNVNETDKNMCSALFYVGRIKNQRNTVVWTNNDFTAMKSFLELLFNGGLKTANAVVLTGPYTKIIATAGINELEACSVKDRKTYVIRDAPYQIVPLVYRYERSSYTSEENIANLQPYLNRGKRTDVWFVYSSEQVAGKVALGYLQLH